MASVLGTVMRKQLRALRPLFRRFADLEEARKAQDALGDLGAKALKEDVGYLMECFDKFEADWALPTNETDARKAVLYLHGGSYTAGTLRYARGFGGILAHLLKHRVLCVGYRLAPEHPFPAALDDAFEAYNRVLEGRNANDIALIGESAGGGLCYALMKKLQNEGVALPGCVVTLSAWCDLTLSNVSVKTNAECDPNLFEDALRYSAACYGKDDLKNPLVSPQFADVTGFPRALVFCGTDELLMDDTLVMKKKFDDAGIPCDSVVADGMWHVYPLYGIPESDEALKTIKAFVYEALGETAECGAGIPTAHPE